MKKIHVNAVINKLLKRQPLCSGLESVRVAWGRLGVPLLNAWQQMWVSGVLGDDHFKRVSLLKVNSGCGTLMNPRCAMAMGAKKRSKFQPFNVDVSIWVQNSGVELKALNKHANKNLKIISSDYSHGLAQYSGTCIDVYDICRMPKNGSRAMWSCIQWQEFTNLKHMNYYFMRNK